MCGRTSETQQEQSCTSIGKSIILTYFTIPKDRAALETSDFEWKLVRFSYRLQESGDITSDLSVQVLPFSPNTIRRPEEKISFKISLRRPKEKDIFIACNASDACHCETVQNPIRRPKKKRGSGCSSDATHARYRDL